MTQITSRESSIKGYTLSLETTRTLTYIAVELQELYAQQGHYCDIHNVCHTPRARMVCSAFHPIKAVVSQIRPTTM